VLMALGLFVFSLKTAPFETVTRETGQRWSGNARAAGTIAYQYLGPDDDTLTIDGILMPELTGGIEALDKLREMAAEGKAWILISGDGRNLGRWFIENVGERGTYHAANGLPRRIEFSLALTRYWDDDPAALGTLKASLP
jgi:uncharacterized protein